MRRIVGVTGRATHVELRTTRVCGAAIDGLRREPGRRAHFLDVEELRLLDHPQGAGVDKRRRPQPDALEPGTRGEFEFKPAHVISAAAERIGDLPWTGGYRWRQPGPPVPHIGNILDPRT